MAWWESGGLLDIKYRQTNAQIPTSKYQLPRTSVRPANSLRDLCGLRVQNSRMRWVEQPIFFVDFEGSQATGILEYGVVTVLGGRVVETITRLCCAVGQVRAEE